MNARLRNSLEPVGVQTDKNVWNILQFGEYCRSRQGVGEVKKRGERMAFQHKCEPPVSRERTTFLLNFYLKSSLVYLSRS